MPNFEDLGLQASLKGHETGDLNGEGKSKISSLVGLVSFECPRPDLTAHCLGPKLPNVKKLLPEMRKEGLLGEQANRLEMRSQGSVSGGVGREGNFLLWHDLVELSLAKSHSYQRRYWKPQWP